VALFAARKGWGQEWSKALSLVIRKSPIDRHWQHSILRNQSGKIECQVRVRVMDEANIVALDRLIFVVPQIIKCVHHRSRVLQIQETIEASSSVPHESVMIARMRR
jgi:hypothetical protein